MATEIERKYLLAEVPMTDRLGVGVDIRQGYIAEDDDVEVRVRITQDAATLTVKAGSGLTRTEVDLPIAVEQAEALWPHTSGRRLVKTRYRVVLDESPGHVAEVDVYGGELDGLSVVEVEFGAEADAAGFTPPAWFGRDLTGEVGWSNAALARHGRPGDRRPRSV